MNQSGKLYLHRTPHLILPGRKHEVNGLRKREDILAQDVGKRDELPARPGAGVAYHAVVEVECGDKIFQCPRLEGVGHGNLYDVEAVVGGEILAFGRYVGEGVERGLSVSQGEFHRRGLKHMPRMLGRETKRQSAVDNILAQPGCHLHHPVFSHFVVDGIIIERTPHA